jgi:hypothetical protein
MNSSCRLPSLPRSESSPSPNPCHHQRDVSPHRAFYLPVVDHSSERLRKMDLTRVSATNALSSFSPSPCRYASSERDLTPTGFNHPRSIMTPIKTVRRMFHYADDRARQNFYSAFLERPTPSK